MVSLALVSILCFIVVSIAPESLNSESAKYLAVTSGKIELFTFYERKLKKIQIKSS